MERELWCWDAVELAAADAADAAEVIEAQRGLSTPIDPVR
jgi:hypothetical protein